MDVIYLDFSEAFDTVFHTVLLEKLAARGLGGCTLCWVENRLRGWTQRGGEQSHKWCSPGLSTGDSSV